MAYVLFDRLLTVRPALALGISPWNAGAGLSLAYLLFVGGRGIPVVIIALLFAEATNHLATSAPGALLAGCTWTALLHGLLAESMRRRDISLNEWTPLLAAQFAGGCTLASFLAAIGYATAFCIGGVLPAQELPYAIARRGLADLNGLLLAAPLAVAVLFPGAVERAPRLQTANVIWPVLAMTLTLALLFALPAADQLRFFYLLFVPVIWIALRWGLLGAILSAFVAHAILIIAARTELHAPRFVDLQMLLLTLALTALMLGAVVTGRRRAEERARRGDALLARASRFAVAGEMASAVAHELRQPMTALVSYVQAGRTMAARSGSPDEALVATLEKAAAEAMRSTAVLNRLRDFYTGGERITESIQVDRICRKVADYFRERSRAAGIWLDLQLEAGLPPLKGDPTQLEIVLHNLVSNALDAVAGQVAGERRVWIKAWREAERLMICVEDTGPGVDAEILPRLFDPFVTGKGSGMGLGLAISRTLVRAWPGELSFAPGTGGRGARFKISLPLEPNCD